MANFSSTSWGNNFATLRLLLGHVYLICLGPKRWGATVLSSVNAVAVRINMALWSVGRQGRLMWSAQLYLRQLLWTNQLLAMASVGCCSTAVSWRYAHAMTILLCPVLLFNITYLDEWQVSDCMVLRNVEISDICFLSSQLSFEVNLAIEQ